MTPTPNTPAQAVKRVLEYISVEVHKNMSHGPDGFAIYKNDVYRILAKAEKHALTPDKPSAMKGKFL